MAVKSALQIVCVGGKPLPFVQAGADHYTSLIQKWCAVSIHSVKDHNREPAVTQVRKETDEVIRYLDGRPGRRILLDARGRLLTSEGFAAALQTWLTVSHNIIFLVGGIHGFGEAIDEVADERLSLSPLTFNHLMLRLVLLEQIFRAFSIIHQTSYHR